MRHDPEHHLISRETRSERRKRDAVQAARASRAPDAPHRLAIRTALKACADEFGSPIAFAAGVAELLRHAPQITVKHSARSEAERVFKRGGRS